MSNSGETIVTSNSTREKAKNIVDAHAELQRYSVLEMNDGEIINNSTGYTIYNKGGTAIQRGGVSAKNFGVTVE